MARRKQQPKKAAPAHARGRASSPKHASGTKTKPIRDAESIKQRNQISAIILFAISILMVCLVLISGDHLWLWTHNVMLGLFGTCAITWPILIFYISIITAFERQNNRLSSRVIMIVIIIALFCAAVYIFTHADNPNMKSFWDKLLQLYQLGVQRSGAGLFSGLIGIPIVAALGATGAKIVIILMLFVAVMILTGTSLVQLFRVIAKPADLVANNINTAREQRGLERSRNIDIALGPEDELPQHPVQSPGKAPAKQEKSKKLERLEKLFSAKEPVVEKLEPAQTMPPVVSAADKSGIAEAAAAFAAKKAELPKKDGKQPPIGAPVQLTMFTDEPPQDGNYHFPPVSMLEATKEPNEQDVTEELKTNGRMLVETLKSFGVQTKIVDISRGPAVTRYELQPAAGVKISKITNLSDDIAMNLAASGVRIEAPIPGKAAVGIEVPNKKVNIVRMRDLIESNSFSAAKSRLTVVLGRDIAGEVVTADLSKMPHLLIAGSTGSGKSVCINSFIISLLYKSTPDEVRFLMIDPKVVELGIYNGIPHLLVPVVTDPRKAAGALNWAVTEMLKRYKIFAENNVRDLIGYNALAASCNFQDANGQPMQHMPQIVMIIDELADLMMAAPNEVEDSICRLAQMARAAGMHLLIATQRPSVDVITGIIKANIPSRIAFAVSSQVDSRTILDSGGAEKLLGRGDMLFSPVGSQKPIRIQGCFVSDSEIESVVNFVKKTQEAGYDKNIAEEIEKNAVAEKDAPDSSSDDDNDPMIPEAVKCVVEAGQASTSLLQRRLRLGYARAGRLIDEMEQMGIVGPHEGSKPRQVLITYQQWLEMSMRQNDEANQNGAQSKE
ncbi:MAG TPA: DNA translocase FtsK 4TM domain-containing protein [Caproiciproducens sp.]|nr:DNA translocase FtsK 4TM domain-containing protein [Caproiciproducens sp.]